MLILKRISFPLSLSQQQPPGNNLAYLSTHANLCCVVVSCVFSSVAVRLNICSKLARDTFYFLEHFTGFAWFPTLDPLCWSVALQGRISDIQCLTINVCFCPSCHQEIWTWSFPALSISTKNAPGFGQITTYRKKETELYSGCSVVVWHCFHFRQCSSFSTPRCAHAPNLDVTSNIHMLWSLGEHGGRSATGVPIYKQQDRNSKWRCLKWFMRFYCMLVSCCQQWNMSHYLSA